MTTKAAIEHVLTDKRKMRVPEIIEQAAPLATGLKDKTPARSSTRSSTPRPSARTGSSGLTAARSSSTRTGAGPRRRGAARTVILAVVLDPRVNRSHATNL
jgi:hypothetical protein